jgi:hypothetical protein
VPGAVKVAVELAPMSPVSKARGEDVEVRVWVTESSLVTVTFVPGATVRLPGLKLKFLMTIVFAAVGDAVEGAGLGEEQPASTADAVTAADRRRTGASL